MQLRFGAFIHSSAIERLHYPADCAFKTERAAMTKSLLRSMGLFNPDGCREVTPRPASDKELYLFHEPRYIEALRRVSKEDFKANDLFLGLGTVETPVFSDLYTYAELAAGATITGAEMILYGDVNFVFNPSGGFHNALPAFAGGYSYINDVVLGCKTLSSKGKRVFCLNIDARHGNGTQLAFYNDPTVFTVSFHESGKTLYPWGGFENEIGEGKGYGYNVNIPMPAGTDDDSFKFAFNAIVPPLLESYAPEVIVLQIGMNTLSVDPSTHLMMTNNAMADVLSWLGKKETPLLVVGGGGNNAEQTARGWALAWHLLAGNDTGRGSPGNHSTTLPHQSLRDPPAAVQSNEQSAIKNQLSHSVELVKRMVFQIHKM